MNEDNKLDLQMLDDVSGGGDAILMQVYCKECQHVHRRDLLKEDVRDVMVEVFRSPCPQCGKSDWGIAIQNS